MGDKGTTHRNKMSKISLIKSLNFGVLRVKQKLLKTLKFSKSIKHLSWVPTLIYFKSLKKRDLPVTLVFLALFFHILQRKQVHPDYAIHPPTREQRRTRFYESCTKTQDRPFRTVSNFLQY